MLMIILFAGFITSACAGVMFPLQSVVGMIFFGSCMIAARNYGGKNL